MEKSQLDNLLKIYVIFHKNFFHHPDYIMEKWDAIIGTKVERKILTETSTTGQITWCNTWCVKWEDYSNIIHFFTVLSSYDLGEITPGKIIDIYDSYIGDPHLINKTNWNGIHRVSLHYMEDYIKKYLREYNLELCLR
jgi:hypothetical protein